MIRITNSPFRTRLFIAFAYGIAITVVGLVYLVPTLAPGLVGTVPNDLRAIPDASEAPDLAAAIVLCMAGAGMIAVGAPRTMFVLSLLGAFWFLAYATNVGLEFAVIVLTPSALPPIILGLWEAWQRTQAVLAHDRAIYDRHSRW